MCAGGYRAEDDGGERCASSSAARPGGEVERAARVRGGLRAQVVGATDASSRSEPS